MGQMVGVSIWSESFVFERRRRSELVGQTREEQSTRVPLDGVRLAFGWRLGGD
jgi:hypothetical protein